MAERILDCKNNPADREYVKSKVIKVFRNFKAFYTCFPANEAVKMMAEDEEHEMARKQALCEKRRAKYEKRRAKI